MDNYITKQDLEILKADLETLLYKALLIQTFAMAALFGALKLV